jgi:hypothetical protein
MKVPIKNIPTYDANKDQWLTTSFDSQKQFATYLMQECFKEPGEYAFDESTRGWNKLAKIFEEERVYTQLPEGSNDWWKFWDEEELKCRLGVLWKHNDKTWYLTRDYYFLINYCPIINKEKGNEEGFMSVRDVQYHMMIYEKIAELFHLHAAILKKRQMAFSNCHSAKALNFTWFENKKTIKLLASDEAYIDDVNGSWKMINAFKNHLNQHTGWIRIFSPESYPAIQQKEKIKVNGKWVTEGNESTLVAKTLKRDVTTAVGGAAYWIWHEEGGIAPKADMTLQYIDPAISVSTTEKSGAFCIGGSVGDLDDCKPLMDFMREPEKFEIFAVPTKWYDETKQEKMCGLFIPTQYGMPEACDEFGNTEVEKALELLKEQEKIWEKLPPEQYILKKSQNPKTIKEAFAWRKQAYFNVQRIERRQEELKIQLQNEIVKQDQGLLYEGKDGNIKLKKLNEFDPSNRPEEIGYPVKETLQDKRGCVTIWEKPEHDTPNLYYAGVDPIGLQDNFTSPSVFSMHIYKRGYTEIDQTTGDKKTVRGKLVATYRGRFKSVEDTNEMGLLLLRLYKAKAACERNKDNFINYCRRKGFSTLIAMKKDLPFDKDIDMAGTKNDEYGIYKGADGALERTLKKCAYDYLEVEIDTIHKKIKDSDEIGDVVKTIRGYQLVNDYWMLEEYKLYNDEDNFDSFISSSLAIAYGTAAELTYEKKVFTQSESKKPKQPPKPKIINRLPTYGRTQVKRNPNQKNNNNRSLLNY